MFKSIIVQTDLLLQEEARILSVANFDLEIQKIEWDINVLQEKLASNKT